MSFSRQGAEHSRSSPGTGLRGPEDVAGIRAGAGAEGLQGQSQTKPRSWNWIQESGFLRAELAQESKWGVRRAELPQELELESAPGLWQGTGAGLRSARNRVGPGIGARVRSQVGMESELK